MATRFNSRKMEAGVKLLLEGMGMDNNNPDFQGTPKRVAKLYREMLSPKRQEATVAFPSIYAGMVILRHHLVHTMCPHHLLPVEMEVSVGYIPGKKTLGLSKLARIAESVLTKPIKQEEFTDLVAYRLSQLADPKGIGVYVVGKHGCMRHRGVHTRGDVVTSTMRGAFFVNSATRSEFLEIVMDRP
jgi:GTP cyclohydrolase I